MSDAPTERTTTLGSLLLPGTCAVLAYGAVAQGAFYPSQTTAFTSALVALAVLTVGARTWREVLPLIPAFGILAAGLLASAAATGWPHDALAPAAGLTASLAAFVLGRVLILRGELEELLWVVAWVAAGVALLGFAGVAFHVDAWALIATDLRRASSTFTYANAAAAFLVLALPTSLGARGGRASRGLTFAILTGLGVTASRGGLGAAAILAVVAAALGARKPLVRAWPAVAGAIVAVGGAVPSMVGADPRPMPALAALVLGMGIAVGVPVRRERAAGPQRIAVASLVIVGVIAAGAVAAGPGLGRLIGSRVNLSNEGRIENWSATLEASLDHPWFGSGPGTYAFEVSRFAHNEYLQAFSETGAVGLAAVIVALVLFARAALRSRPHDEGWALACAACAAYAAHSAVDFVWHFPVLLLVAFLWLARATVRGPVVAPDGDPVA